MHPLMAAYALWAALALALIRSSHRLRATASLSAMTLTTAACLQFTAKPESAAYTHIALTRTYWFPAMWAWYELVGLAAPLAILLAFAWTTSRRTTRPNSAQAQSSLARMAIAVGALAFLVAVCFARASAANHFIARMQPLRVFQIVYLIMVSLLGAKLGESVLRRSSWRWIAALCLLGGIMFATQRATFPNSPSTELPWTIPRNPWTQAFLGSAITPQRMLSLPSTPTTSTPPAKTRKVSAPSPSAAPCPTTPRTVVKPPSPRN